MEKEGHSRAIENLDGFSVLLHARIGLLSKRIELVKGSGQQELDALFRQIAIDALETDNEHAAIAGHGIDRLDTAMELPTDNGVTRCRILARISSFHDIDVFGFTAKDQHLRWREVDHRTLHRAIDSYYVNFLAARQIAYTDNLGLTPRMIECLQWTAGGKTSEEIAIILDLSAHTVSNYLAMATQKLNAVNRAQAVARALSLGLISTE